MNFIFTLTILSLLACFVSHRKKVAIRRLNGCLNNNNIQQVDLTHIEVSEYLTKSQQHKVFRECLIAGFSFQIGFSDRKIIV